MRTAWIESMLTKLLPLPPLLFSTEPPSMVMLFPFERLPATLNEAPPEKSLHLRGAGVIHHARQQRHQRREVAVHHRQVLHLLRGDEAGALARRGLHRGDFGLYGHRF